MGAGVNRVTTVAMVAVVLVGTSALGYGVARASAGQPLLPSYGRSAAATTAQPIGDPPARTRTRSSNPSASPSTSGSSAAPATRAADHPKLTAPLPSARPRATLAPGPRLLGRGDHGPRVRDLQARLRQIAWWSGNVTDDYGPTTASAVKGFQDKREIAVTGYVDRRTLDRLSAMTRAADRGRARQQAAGQHLDRRCPRRTLPHRPGDVRRQDRQHDPLGRRRQGAPDDGGALRCVVLPDPRGPLPRQPQVARPRVDALRLRDAVRDVLLRRPGRPLLLRLRRPRLLQVPRTAASTSATAPASSGSSPRSTSATRSSSTGPDGRATGGRVTA